MTYGTQPPSLSVVSATRDDIMHEATRIADNPAGCGKVVKVRIEVTFGDGSSVAHEVRRTPQS